MSMTSDEVKEQRRLARRDLRLVGIEPDAKYGHIGSLRTGKRVFEFALSDAELWVGSVSSGSPLSLEEATALDLAAYDGPRPHSDGMRGVLGDVARWRNSYRGMAPSHAWGSELREQNWVFDTLAALDAFVRKVLEMEGTGGARSTSADGDTVAAVAVVADETAEQAWERGRLAGMAEAAGIDLYEGLDDVGILRMHGREFGFFVYGDPEAQDGRWEAFVTCGW